MTSRLPPANETSSTPDPLTISFIIPALNEGCMLRRVLRSISLQVCPRKVSISEIIVVDAGSTDNTAAIAKAAGCHVVQSKAGNVAMSRNSGALHASGDVLAFIDADCELPSNWVQDVCLPLARPELVASGGVMRRPMEADSWVVHAWHCLAHRRTDQAGSNVAEWLPTFNLAVDQSAFQEVGGFDTTLMTCEDVEIGYRLNLAGELQEVVTAPVIHHGESQTLVEFFKRESWRAQGNLVMLQSRPFCLREFLSTALPVVVTVLMGMAFIAAVLTGIAALSSDFNRSNEFGLLPPAITSATLLFVSALCLVCVPLPAFLLSITRRVPIRRLPACSLLLCVYFAARCAGLFRNFQRVERTDTNPIAC